MQANTPPRRFAVYRLYDISDRLIYIGRSKNLEQRFEEHRYSQPWWDEVASFSVEWFDQVGRARAAEQYAIRKEQPKYNIVSVNVPLKWLRRRYEGLVSACPEQHPLYNRIQRLGTKVYRAGLFPEDIRDLESIMGAYRRRLSREREAAEGPRYFGPEGGVG